MIDGVQLKPLTTHPDERGFFREVLRAGDPLMAEGFAQWSHSFMHAGVVKAWHWHIYQVDWWYLVGGRLKVVLYDLRFLPGTETGTDEVPAFNWRCPSLSKLKPASTAGELMELILGDGPAVLRIPPGVAHGCKALTDTHLLYITSREYDGSDEGRLAHDDPVIGYDWLKGVEIK